MSIHKKCNTKNNNETNKCKRKQLLTFIQKATQHHVARRPEPAHFLFHSIRGASFLHFHPHRGQKGVNKLTKRHARAVNAEFFLPQIAHVEICEHRGGVEGAGEKKEKNGRTEERGKKRTGRRREKWRKKRIKGYREKQKWQ